MRTLDKEELKKVDKTLFIIIVSAILFWIGYFVGGRNVETTSPVEEIVKADSLVKVNDSIKVVVNNLDSIKNAKIIEVKTLDNDSTIKLFYELINK